jgi:methenyltetrahydromethanopterin cyclohydrolase
MNLHLPLNHRAWTIVEEMIASADELRVRLHACPGGGRVLDCGVEEPGGLEAGRRLAEVCMAGMASIAIAPGELGGVAWPQVQVATDHPVAACLLSQYAGWQISVEKFFAMGSGPMRAAAAREELFEKLAYREAPSECVGVLETGRLPDDGVFEWLAERTGIPSERTILLAAPTSSIAGNFQVVARAVETALHKLFELGFDVQRIASAFGTAPLSPVAADDMTGIGRTNDAILYGGRVTLWVRGDDESIAEIGPRVPSAASAAHGQPFLEIFESAGRDFYQIDPHLFSPAEVVFHNLDSGHVQAFGRCEPEVLRKSFGLV